MLITALGTAAGGAALLAVAAWTQSTDTAIAAIMLALLAGALLAFGVGRALPSLPRPPRRPPAAGEQAAAERGPLNGGPVSA